MRLLIALCLFCAGASNAAEDWLLTLQNVRQKVIEAIGRSDNYICMQDLSRFYYDVSNPALACRQPPAVPYTPPRLQDRLKLDVAVSQGSEIYSWHGDNKFAATTVSQVVREGPIASGSFNGYLRNIFGERGVSFTYRGLSKINGLDLYSFDYEVPLAASHYQVQAGKHFVLTPFHGSFSAHAGNFLLYSLVVTADEDKLSQKTDICASETRLVYQSVRIGSHDSLLPASFDLLIGGQEGSFTESKGLYSACREYTGESTLHFDIDDTEKDVAGPAKLESEPLRSGIYLRIALRGQIDEESAYAGMPVEAVLVHAAKIGKGITLPRGAELRGVITRFQIVHRPAHAVVMKLEFNSITDGKTLYLCSAIHAVIPTSPLGFPVGRRGSMPVRGMNQLNEPSDGSMVFNDSHVHLDKSLTSLFITVDRSESDAR
jgi:hypothetical protein